MNILDFTWILTILSLTGVILNIYKMKVCFYIWLITNAVWAVVDFWQGIPSQGTIFVFQFFLAAWGIWQWRTKKKPKYENPMDHLACWCEDCHAHHGIGWPCPKTYNVRIDPNVCAHENAYHFHENAPMYCPDCDSYGEGDEWVQTVIPKKEAVPKTNHPIVFGSWWCKNCQERHGNFQLCPKQPLHISNFLEFKTYCGLKVNPGVPYPLKIVQKGEDYTELLGNVCPECLEKYKGRDWNGNRG